MSYAVSIDIVRVVEQTKALRELEAYKAAVQS